MKQGKLLITLKQEKLLQNKSITILLFLSLLKINTCLFSQNNSVEQQCLNIFSDKVKTNDYLKKFSKISFKGSTEGLITNLEKNELLKFKKYNNHIYDSIINKDSLLKKIQLKSSFKKRKRKINLYIYNAINIGDFFYVKFNLYDSKKNEGVFLYFQVDKNTHDVIYFIEPYIY